MKSKTRAMIMGVGGAALWAALAASVTAQAEETSRLSGSVTVDSTPPAREEALKWTGYADVVEKVSPSVVTVLASKKVENASWNGSGGSNPLDDPRLRRFFEERGLAPFFGQPGPGNNGRGADPRRQMPSPKQEGQGSGVVLTSDGFVLTNNHVIQGADEIQVVLERDSDPIEAEVVGRDPQTDLAVLKIESRDLNLKAATLGDSAQLRAGDTVLAIGNPFGLNKTVTHGIVSATGRNNLNITGYEDFIQTDASINPGNSGGALVDNRGRVVGINTAIFSRTGGNIGIGFAIPINMALEIADDLMTDGEVERGYLGIMMGELSPDLAKALDIEGKGVLVNEVMGGSPADKAGLEDGDVITALDGEEVADMASLRFNVGRSEPGEKRTFTIVRDGKEREVGVKIGRLDPEVAANSAPRRGAGGVEPSSFVEGVRVAELSDLVRERYGIADEIESGLVIVEVDPDSEAAVVGLREGDVITEVSREPVESVKEALAAKKDVRNDMLLLRVASADGSRFVAIDVS